MIFQVKFFQTIHLMHVILRDLVNNYKNYNKLQEFLPRSQRSRKLSS